MTSTKELIEWLENCVKNAKLNQNNIVVNYYEEASQRLRELEARLAAVQKDAAWQPIEKAPKDGSEILVAFKSVGVKCVSWTDREWDSSSEFALWCVNDNKFEPHPLRGYNSGDEIGWMPLPKSPTAIAKDTQLTALSEMVKLSEELGLYASPIAGEAT